MFWRPFYAPRTLKRLISFKKNLFGPYIRHRVAVTGHLHWHPHAPMSHMPISRPCTFRSPSKLPTTTPPSEAKLFAPQQKPLPPKAKYLKSQIAPITPPKHPSSFPCGCSNGDSPSSSPSRDGDVRFGSGDQAGASADGLRPPPTSEPIGAFAAKEAPRPGPSASRPVWGWTYLHGDVICGATSKDPIGATDTATASLQTAEVVAVEGEPTHPPTQDFSYPPRWGEMVLATSRKIPDKEPPLGTYPL